MSTEEIVRDSQLTAVLEQMAWGFTTSRILYAAAKMGIVDIIGDDSRDISEIAAAIDADEPSLRRLCRALASINILTEIELGQFKATEMGKLLGSNHPQSMRPAVMFSGAPFVWEPWGELPRVILSGRPAFDQMYGENLFEYFKKHPQDSAVFNEAMTYYTQEDLPAFLEGYNFTGFKKIVDVGGGQGLLLRAILQRYPDVTGVLCDDPLVVAEAAEIRGTPEEARCEFVGMDILQSVPEGGDVYILKSILHDWGDTEALQILRNCRRAIHTTGKILAVDMVLKPFNEPDLARIFDIHMLVLHPGRERTEEEFRALYAAAGFLLTRVIFEKGLAIIEGIPIEQA